MPTEVGDVDFRHDDGGSCSHEALGVVGLVVFGDVGRRNQHRRRTRAGELAQGSGSGPREDEVRRAKHARHVVDEGADLASATLAKSGNEVLGIEASALPKDLDVARTPHVFARSHALVDGAGALASAKDEYKRLDGVESEGKLGVSAQGLGGGGAGQRREVGSHGVSGEANAVGGECRFHAGVGHADGAGLFAQPAVGPTGKAVLLLNQGRNPHSLRHPKCGAADVAAGSDYEVRTFALHDGADAL